MIQEVIALTTAQVRQWVSVVPLSVRDRALDTLEIMRESEVGKLFSSLTLSRAQRIAKAIQTAYELAEFEVFYESRQHLGFVRLWVNTRNGQERLDIEHRIHFRGAEGKIHQFAEKHGMIKFTALKQPLEFSDPTKTESYLKIEHTKYGNPTKIELCTLELERKKKK